MTLRRVTSLKGVLVTDSHSILARWRNSFSQLLNVHGVTDLRQTGIMFEASACEVQMAIGKLKKKSSGIDYILAEFIKAGGRTTCSDIHKLINSIWNKEELPEQWQE